MTNTKLSLKITTNQVVKIQEYEEMVEQLILLAKEADMIRRFQQMRSLANPEELI